MQTEKSPEELVKEQVEAFQLLLQIPGNLALNNKIISFINSQPSMESIEERIIESAKPHFRDVICYKFLGEAFDIAFYIHYFHSEPYKVLNYIKAKLYKYEVSMRELHLDLLLDIINDRSRFDFDSNSLEYIVSELSNIDINFERVNFPIGKGAIEYFSDDKGILLDKHFMTSWLAVRGFLQTKQNYYLSFLKENYSPELLQAISQLGLTIVNPPTTDDKNKTIIKKLLSSDILELKPNIGGIGINLNEIINRLFKR